MPQADHTLPPTLDTALAEWVRAGDESQTQELIVQAVLPKRMLKVSQEVGKRQAFSSVGPDRQQERKRLLDELQHFLQDDVAVPTVPLKAAGAFAIRATPSQVVLILTHPAVARLSSNRHLHSKQ